MHYHALGPSSLAWLPRLAGKRAIVTVHGLDWRREKWGFVASAALRGCETAATRFPNATIVVSQTLERHFRAQGRRVFYVPNGTPLPEPATEVRARALGLEPGRYVLFVGRIVPEKGVHLLVDAHARFAPEWTLAIAGEGTLHRRVRRALPQGRRGERTFPRRGLRGGPARRSGSTQRWWCCRRRWKGFPSRCSKR